MEMYPKTADKCTPPSPDVTLITEIMNSLVLYVKGPILTSAAYHIHKQQAKYCYTL